MPRSPSSPSSRSRVRLSSAQKAHVRDCTLRHLFQKAMRQTAVETVRTHGRDGGAEPSAQTCAALHPAIRSMIATPAAFAHLSAQPRAPEDEAEFAFLTECYHAEQARQREDAGLPPRPRFARPATDSGLASSSDSKSRLPSSTKSRQTRSGRRSKQREEEELEKARLEEANERRMEGLDEKQILQLKLKDVDALSVPQKEKDRLKEALRKEYENMKETEEDVSASSGIDQSTLSKWMAIFKYYFKQIYARVATLVSEWTSNKAVAKKEAKEIAEQSMFGKLWSGFTSAVGTVVSVALKVLWELARFLYAGAALLLKVGWSVVSWIASNPIISTMALILAGYLKDTICGYVGNWWYQTGSTSQGSLTQAVPSIVREFVASPDFKSTVDSVVSPAAGSSVSDALVSIPFVGGAASVATKMMTKGIITAGQGAVSKALVYMSYYTDPRLLYDFVSPSSCIAAFNKEKNELNAIVAKQEAFRLKQEAEEAEHARKAMQANRADDARKALRSNAMAADRKFVDELQREKDEQTRLRAQPMGPENVRPEDAEKWRKIEQDRANAEQLRLRQLATQHNLDRPFVDRHVLGRDVATEENILAKMARDEDLQRRQRLAEAENARLSWYQSGKQASDFPSRVDELLSAETVPDEQPPARSPLRAPVIGPANVRPEDAERWRKIDQDRADAEQLELRRLSDDYNRSQRSFVDRNILGRDVATEANVLGKLARNKDAQRRAELAEAHNMERSGWQKFWETGRKTADDFAAEPDTSATDETVADTGGDGDRERTAGKHAPERRHRHTRDSGERHRGKHRSHRH